MNRRANAPKAAGISPRVSIALHSAMRAGLRRRPKGACMLRRVIAEVLRPAQTLGKVSAGKRGRSAAVAPLFKEDTPEALVRASVAVLAEEDNAEETTEIRARISM